MIKFIVAALWISIATTGALLFAFQFSQPEETVEGAEATPFQGLDYVKTGIISVPVFDKGRVHGYFLSRLVFVADGKRLAQLKLPPEALLSDHVYSYLYGNPEIDFASRKNFNVDAFRDAVRVGVNEKLGEELIREILVEQVDYLPKEEVGTSKGGAGANAVRPAEGVTVPPASH